MGTESTWTSLETAKLLISVLTPLAIVLLGYWVNGRLHQLELQGEQERDNRQRLREEERRLQEAREQKEREELERRYTPHIEFDIDCNFFGPHHGKYAAEFILTANNRGITKHQFTSIVLRVRGIRQGAPLLFWEEQYEHRLKFPEKILEDEVKPKRWNYIFVEPGVRQCIGYTTIIDAEIKYITARAEFYYKQYEAHSTERMFEVRSSQGRIQSHAG
jgi:hypothetical protein